MRDLPIGPCFQVELSYKPSTELKSESGSRQHGVSGSTEGHHDETAKTHAHLSPVDLHLSQHRMRVADLESQSRYTSPTVDLCLRKPPAYSGSLGTHLGTRPPGPCHAISRAWWGDLERISAIGPACHECTPGPAFHATDSAQAARNPRCGLAARADSASVLTAASSGINRDEAGASAEIE